MFGIWEQLITLVWWCRNAVSVVVRLSVLSLVASSGSLSPTSACICSSVDPYIIHSASPSPRYRHVVNLVAWSGDVHVNLCVIFCGNTVPHLTLPGRYVHRNHKQLSILIHHSWPLPPHDECSSCVVRYKLGIHIPYAQGTIYLLGTWSITPCSYL